MEFTARQIADYLKGDIEGNAEIIVTGASKIEDSEPGTITFLANLQYAKYLYTSNASAVILNRNFIPEKEISPTIIRVDDAYQAFASLLEMVKLDTKERIGIDSITSINPSATIGKNVYIGAFCVIEQNVKIGDNVKIYPQSFIGENTQIGDNSVIYAGVKIYHNCEIGKNCTIHSGTVIGSDGFGFAPQSDLQYKKVPQIGKVIVEDFVEIGSNSCIDRATLGATIIRNGVKLDNLIQVAHNVEIGENTVMAAQSGIAGSTHVGSNCMIGGQVGIVGHITIADNVKMAAQTGVASSIDTKGIIVQGSPSYKQSDYQKSFVVFKHLPEIKKQISVLEKEIEKLKKHIG